MDQLINGNWVDGLMEIVMTDWWINGLMEMMVNKKLNLYTNQIIDKKNEWIDEWSNELLIYQSN